MTGPDLHTAILARLARLGPTDLRFVLWMTDRLPMAALESDLRTRDDAGLEPLGRRTERPATSAEEGALGSLLRTARLVGRVLGVDVPIAQGVATKETRACER